jgi:tetraacyldisaccharide 4'-kinase
VRSFEETLKKIWEGERADGVSVALSTALRLLSPLYQGVVATRNDLYDRGVLRQAKLSCPVISVGNLTVGGTGKTPTVILLANLLREQGRRPAVLSRGYGGRAKGPVTVVSDGNSILMDWHEAGDEPVLIAGAAPGVPVLTGPRRLLTGRAAIDRFGADCLILDDAFQHRELARDLDIVLIDAARPFGNGRLLPAGPLREQPSSLRRAGLLVRTGEERSTQESICQPGLPTFRGIRSPQGVVEGKTGKLLPASILQGKKVCAFAGIGRPDAFRTSLAALGAEIVSFRSFPDHHPYGPQELEDLRRLAKATRAARIITTEKDGVRLADDPDFLREIDCLRIGMEIAPADAFAALLFPRLLY